MDPNLMCCAFCGGRMLWMRWFAWYICEHVYFQRSDDPRHAQ